MRPGRPTGRERRSHRSAATSRFALASRAAAAVVAGDEVATSLVAAWGAEDRVDERYVVRPIGWVESELVDRALAPKQGPEGGPAAWLVFEPAAIEGLRDL